MMEERKTSIAKQIINSIKMKQINILFLLLLPLFSIGQQTLSLEECYALSIKLSIARQTDLLKQNQSWKLKRLIKQNSLQLTHKQHISPM
jgi:hypothetical protein